MSGKKFGYYFVTDESYSDKSSRIYWKCICECGNKKFIRSDVLIRGIHSISCGCKRKEHAIKKHGLSGTRTYKSWDSMRERCLSKKHPHYKYYGGKGITICKEWSDYNNFLKDMGQRPLGKTLDRIDNSKGYCKDNCKWSSAREQNLNKTNNRYLTYKGLTLTVTEWASKISVKRATLFSRIHNKMPIEKVLKEYLIDNVEVKE